MSVGTFLAVCLLAAALLIAGNRISDLEQQTTDLNRRLQCVEQMPAGQGLCPGVTR